MSYRDHIAGQIMAAHLLEGELIPGAEIGLRIDQTLTQDATGTLVYLEVMSLGIDRVRTKLSVSYMDHNTLQTGHENADDHLFLQSAAARYGAYFSRPGNGICHQVHLERFGIPGQTLLGSDSHTPTAGGLGMLAMGAGGVDVSLAMAGAAFYMTVPRVTLVRLSGELPPWVGAKDVILHLLGKLTVRGGLGKIMEYGGPAVKRLSVPERATITNMGAELGAWTSLFPSDEVTKRFLAVQKRQESWTPIHAREGADYEEVIEIDLSTLEPLVACPSSPDAVKPVQELSGIKVDQVAIGSCTNSSYRDLKLVAELLRGKTIHPEVSLVIAPGSRQVLSMLAKQGSLGDMIDAGARILEVACGPCIGMGQAPPSGGVSVRTFNRNFPGRSGTPDGHVYLASPQVAVAAALAGRLVHPAELGALPDVADPEIFLVDDSMIIPPPAKTDEITIRMSPNIKPLPELDQLPDYLKLKLLLKLGDNITTDDILPGGSKVLPLRSNLPAISQHVYALKAPGFAEEARSDGDVVILGGENYGQGSSREHAALAPRFLGVRAVLAKSFARLHRANLINFGVLPVLVRNREYDQMEQGDEIELVDVRKTVAENAEIIINLMKKGQELTGRLDLSQRERKVLLAGGRLNLDNLVKSRCAPFY
ncbi:MAG: aconitate hydratase [Deltaproteobacteria bacterium]|nr:aconitate hydratase [Deltaproteobacteria bacterium]MBW1738052.1 aconitate hydratase [Deltaproteobacteria bacterium]MBW2035071.1 aconitate hydratase [Deltaproteobacteria bacterium]MBW2114255.1 aconitate hydratase [Deltaproteobacteria bacterium]